MTRKTYLTLALIMVGLVLGACGKKEEPAATQTQQAPVPEKPAIVPGEMVLIPAGEYIIGSNEKDPVDKSVTNAAPEHKVKMNAFYIDKYEVTNKDYLDFAIKTGYQAEGEKEGKSWRTFFSADKAMIPVVYITWKDANEYCKAQGKRLPTEDEWEAAARGPQGLRFPWGNEWQENKTNTAEAGLVAPADIGKFDDVSPLGVHDMMGNVQEWTANVYKAYPGNPKAGDKQYNQGFKSLRGLSSRFRNAKMTGLWTRAAQYPNFLADFGCRCAKDAAADGAAKATPAK
jgi:formylglycine-generating enzyme required for sulfatase activity